jgi:hypothetical protein
LKEVGLGREDRLYCYLKIEGPLCFGVSEFMLACVEGDMVGCGGGHHAKFAPSKEEIHGEI